MTAKPSRRSNFGAGDPHQCPSGGGGRRPLSHGGDAEGQTSHFGTHRVDGGGACTSENVTDVPGRPRGLRARAPTAEAGARSGKLVSVISFCFNVPSSPMRPPVCSDDFFQAVPPGRPPSRSPAQGERKSSGTSRSAVPESSSSGRARLLASSLGAAASYSCSRLPQRAPGGGGGAVPRPRPDSHWPRKKTPGCPRAKWDHVRAAKVRQPGHVRHQGLDPAADSRESGRLNRVDSAAPLPLKKRNVLHARSSAPLRTIRGDCSQGLRGRRGR